MDHETPRPNLPLDASARAALTAWVDRYWDSIYGHLYRLSGHAHEAEDLTQETFLRAAQRRETFLAGTNERAWLLRIATNAFLDGRRRKQVARAHALPDEAQLPPASVGLADGLPQQELGQALTAALLEVPETPRAVFLLRVREDLSFRDIAETLGGTEANARWQMLQARRKLMELMKGWI